MIFYKKIFFKVLFVACMFLVLFAGCKKDDSNPVDSAPPTFVGTWKLTMLSATISGQPISMTPELAGIQMTIVSKSDYTFSMVTVDASGSKTLTGTWSVSGDNLTLKYSDGSSATFVYSVTGTTLSIKDYPYTHPTFGALLIKLDFTKQ